MVLGHSISPFLVTGRCPVCSVVFIPIITVIGLIIIDRVTYYNILYDL
ncbi:hypothetical protein DEALK_07350 [Dehalogenimonas alkenigignens]|uniref:Uncharacterized protein n=1 Tax=Dehalogenimonas alkenigignens TaxID=1217799 RepID=A0A0W0GH62_9CHLR|nr:hypothetical protein DEALK_07350 [Dehalogenimonas alkenigignens]